MEFATQIDLKSESVVPLPLELSSTIRAWHNVKGSVRGGRAKVRYRFTQRDFSRKEGWNVNNDGSLVSNTKNLDPGVNHLPLNVKSQVSAMVLKTVAYDLRALMFALGKLVAAKTLHMEMPLATSVPHFLAAGASGFCNGNLMIAIPTDVGPEVVYTISLCCTLCGVNYFYVASEFGQMAPPPNGDTDWGIYLRSTFEFLMCDTLDNESGAEHLYAYVRGLSCGYTLHAHSDEGGWVRQLLRTPTYPRPCGYIDTVMENPIVTAMLPRRGHNLLRLQELTLKLLLTSGALVCEADPLAPKGMMTVVENEAIVRPRCTPEALRRASLEGGVLSTSDTGLLKEIGDVEGELADGRPSFCKHLAKVADNISRNIILGLGATFLHLGMSLINTKLHHNEFEWVVADKPDRHLARSILLPYLYIESAPILRHPGLQNVRGPRVGSRSTLPLIPHDDYVRTQQEAGDVDAEGYAGEKSTFFAMSRCGLREMGAFYLCSRAFTPIGAGLNDVIVLGKDGATAHEDLAFSARSHASEDISIAAACWVRADCPIPAPCELSMSSERVMIEVLPNYEGNLRVSQEALNTPVEITCGIPTWDEGAPAGEMRLHRRITESVLTSMGVGHRSFQLNKRRDVAAYFSRNDRRQETVVDSMFTGPTVGAQVAQVSDGVDPLRVIATNTGRSREELQVETEGEHKKPPLVMRPDSVARNTRDISLPRTTGSGEGASPIQNSTSEQVGRRASEALGAEET